MNSYAIGFGVVALLAVAGTDYTVQANKAGQAPGQFAVGRYVGTFAERYTAYTSGIDKARRQAQLAKDHLPEAPEGWERQAYKPEMSDLPQPDYASMSAEERKVAEQVNNSLLGQRKQKDQLKAAKAAAKKEVWEYVRGDETIRLRAIYTNPNAENQGISDTAADMVASQIALSRSKYDGYGVVQGVPFFRPASHTNPDMADLLAADEVQPLTLTAYLGDDIELGVEATARPSSVRMLLESIAYDDLNLMMDKPVEGVGSAAKDLTPLEERQVAEAAVKARFEKKKRTALTLQGKFYEQIEQIADGGSLKAIVGEGDEAAAASAEDAEPGKLFDKVQSAKPTRLQLSGGGSNSGKRCVGSFCD